MENEPCNHLESSHQPQSPSPKPIGRPRTDISEYKPLRRPKADVLEEEK